MGSVNKDHGDIRKALFEGMIAETGAAPPDVQEWNRQHGRRAGREYWWVEADEAMRTDLEQEVGWSAVRWYGRVRCRRALLRAEQWSTQAVMVMEGKSGGPHPTPQQLSQWVRGHWDIESGVCWV